ncbi:MAG: hypothetical protein KA172_06110 [Paludibacter sp.]|nr:hypothetical protein [Paludibacter sp.]
MKNSKTYTKLIVFSSLCLLSQMAFAQDEYEKRQKANKENEEHLNRVYENNLPNKKGTIYSALTPAEIEASWNRTKPTTAKESSGSAEKRIYNQLVFDEEKGEYYTPEEPQSVSFSVASEKMLDALMPALAEKKHLYLTDKLEWYKDTYFATAMNYYYPKLKLLDYDTASDAVLAFSATYNTAAYQSLYDLVWKARILPLSARNMILHLYQKFPEKQKETEMLELKQLPYFFGAARPYIHHRWGELKSYRINPYPGSFYEYSNTPTAMRNEILERFIELANKYPEEGLVAAGFCRPHLNPFTLYAEANKNLTDAQKEDLYWKAIHIKVALPGVDYENSMEKTGYPLGGDDNVFLLFRKPLTWLIEKREDRIKSLTPADWTEISDRTDASLRLINAVNISAERKYKYEDVMLYKKYKNFKTADDNYDKELEKRLKEREKKEKQEKKNKKYGINN